MYILITSSMNLWMIVPRTVFCVTWKSSSRFDIFSRRNRSGHSEKSDKPLYDNVFIFDPIDDFFGNYQECARHVRTYSASSPFASP